MKKLFISCPMRGRSKEAIEKSMEQMRKIAEIVFEQEFEVIDTYIKVVPETKNVSLRRLGMSLELMGDADYYIGIQYPDDFLRGCYMENTVARLYGIPSYLVDHRILMPDVIEIENGFYNNLMPTQTCCPKGE